MIVCVVSVASFVIIETAFPLSRAGTSAPSPGCQRDLLSVTHSECSPLWCQTCSSFASAGRPYRSLGIILPRMTLISMMHT